MKNIVILLSLFILNASDCKSKKNTGKNAETIPECIQEMIIEISSQEVANPPIHIYNYTYNEQPVYYVTSKCCDNPSNLYDQNCNRICSPDGGITGKGDMKCLDFFEKRTDEKLVWKDERKYGVKN